MTTWKAISGAPVDYPTWGMPVVLCEHAHADEASATACARSLGWGWVGHPNPDHGWTMYNLDPYMTGGETIDVSEYLRGRK